MPALGTCGAESFRARSRAIAIGFFLNHQEEFDEWGEDEDADPALGSPREKRRHLTGLCLGFLSMLPLFAVYEVGVSAGHGATRNASELLVFSLFRLLGGGADWARLGTLAVLAACAVWVCHKRKVALIPGTARIGLEGALGALFIGPLIVWSLGLFGDGISSFELHARMQAPSPGSAPDLAQAALVFGGAAYEEVLFRVFLFSLIFLMTNRVAEFFGATAKVGRVTSEVVAALCSSLFFAAFHLSAFVPAIWGGGEDFEAGVFAWRALAGLFLCVLFRVRGPGVAAWTHGLFNLALLVGAGPEVLL